MITPSAPLLLFALTACHKCMPPLFSKSRGSKASVRESSSIHATDVNQTVLNSCPNQVGHWKKRITIKVAFPGHLLSDAEACFLHGGSFSWPLWLLFIFSWLQLIWQYGHRNNTIHGNISFHCMTTKSYTGPLKQCVKTSFSESLNYIQLISNLFKSQTSEKKNQELFYISWMV